PDARAAGSRRLIHRGGGRGTARLEDQQLGLVDRWRRRDLQLGLRREVGCAHLLGELLYAFEVLRKQRQPWQLVRNRNDQLRLDLVDDLGRLRGVDMAAAADRHEEHVDLAADPLELILTEPVPEVTEMTDPKVVDFDGVDEILTPLRALLGV